MAPNGISPALFALVERGAERRPEVATTLRGRVELRFAEGFAPLHLTFEPSRTLVEDAADASSWAPDVVIEGPLPELVRLAAGSLLSAVASVARRRVRISGSALLARRLLKLLEL